MPRRPCRIQAIARDNRAATIAQVSLVTAGILAVLLQLLLA